MGGAIGAYFGYRAMEAGRQREPASQLSAPTPAEVDVAPCVVERVRDFREFTGRTAASSSVEVRPRVDGYIIDSPKSRLLLDQSAENTAVMLSDGQAPARVLAREGDRVNARDPLAASEAGTLLFLIDPKPYQLTLDKAEADLASAEQLLRERKTNVGRLQELLDSKSVSASEFDEAQASLGEQLAQVQSLTATVNRARLDLEYTRVTAPIDGLLGQTQLTIGNLATSDSTVLTTIVANDPVHVLFEIDENSLLEYRSQIRAGKVPSARDTNIPVRVGLANEAGHPHEGFIDFVDNTTDPKTGSTKLRAVIPNKDGTVSPGLFARVLSPFSAEYEAVLIPTRALGMDQQGRFVMVARENLALRQSVEVGSVRGEMTVIRSGLKADDIVIVNGLQKVRHNSPILPREIPLAGVEKPDSTLDPGTARSDGDSSRKAEGEAGLR